MEPLRSDFRCIRANFGTTEALTGCHRQSHFGLDFQLFDAAVRSPHACRARVR